MILHKLTVVGNTKMSINGMPAVWWLGDQLRASGRHANTILYEGLYEELIIADNSKELE